MKKIALGVTIIIIILILRITYEHKQIEACFDKFCPIDCGFSPLPNEELGVCIKEHNFVSKYIRY